MDPIADFITIIRNGYQAKKEQVTAPTSKIKKSIADILVKNGYLTSVEDITVKGHPYLSMTLNYINKIPAIYRIDRVSRPSVRHYAKSGHIPKTLSGSGLTIVTTSAGVLTDTEARQKRIGGEIICKVW
jgi:small subunit ribosomal protein S8